MRSYIKVYRSADFKTIIHNPSGLDITGYETLALFRNRVGDDIPGVQPTFCQIYNKLNRAVTIRYFDASGAEIDLGNYSSALTLTNIIYDLRPYSQHPLD